MSASLAYRATIGESMLNKKLYKLHESYKKHDMDGAIYLGICRHGEMGYPQYVCTCGGEFWMKYGVGDGCKIEAHTADPNSRWATSLFMFMRDRGYGKDIYRFYRKYARTNLGKRAVRIAAKAMEERDDKETTSQAA